MPSIFVFYSSNAPTSPDSPVGDTIGSMKRATITLPDDLAAGIDEYLSAQDAPPALTTVMQTALREYLRERGFLRTFRPLKITPAQQGSGLTDVSANHDKYFAEGEV